MTNERGHSLRGYRAPLQDEPQYNDLFLAIVAIFGNMSEDSKPMKMAKEALKHLPEDEETTVGEAISLERSRNVVTGRHGCCSMDGAVSDTATFTFGTIQLYQCRRLDSRRCHEAVSER